MSTAPPIAPDRLELHGPFREHTYETGVTVGPHALCPVHGCTEGYPGCYSLLRMVWRDGEVWVRPCVGHTPAVLTLARDAAVWRQTKHASKGWGWRAVTVPADGGPPRLSAECVVADADGRIIHGRHPVTGVMWSRPDDPRWPLVTRLFGDVAGGQMDLFSGVA